MPPLRDPVLAPGRLSGRPQPQVPVDDLLLRPWRAEDVQDICAAYRDPEIRRWHVRSMTEAEALGWIASRDELWRTETGADWAVEGTDGLSGRVGLRSLDLAEGVAEAAYWVVPGARLRGVASKALLGMSRWLFAEVGLHRIELVHSTANHASCRAARRAGFAAEGTMREAVLHADGWHDMHLHARLRSDA